MNVTASRLLANRHVFPLCRLAAGGRVNGVAGGFQRARPRGGQAGRPGGVSHMLDAPADSGRKRQASGLHKTGAKRA